MKKQLTSVFIILMVAYVIFRIASYLIVPLFYQLSECELNEVISMRTLLGTLDVFLTYGFNLVSAIVLVQLAKKNGFNRALWFALGAIFGVTALILFFVLDIRSNLLKGNNSMISESENMLD